MEMREYYMDSYGDIITPEREKEDIYESVREFDEDDDDAKESKNLKCKVKETPRQSWLQHCQSKFAISAICILVLIVIAAGCFFVLERTVLVEVVDGKWSEWVNGSCSVSCGTGTMSRFRFCQQPLNGGLECSGVNVVNIECNNQCPVDGRWSEWASGYCSTSCGTGTMARFRTCQQPINGGLNCSGQNVIYSECHNPCPDPTYFVIGGYNSTYLSSVQLYNYKTGKSCELAPIPASKGGHFGTVLNGVHLFCGGVDDTKSSKCFQFDKPSKTFVEMSITLPYDEALATNINVPSLGWYFFSGWYNKTISNSNRLASINSRWTNGPPPPPSDDLYQCAVQIYDTKTAFIGGYKSPKQITVFDWTTSIYTVQTSRFTRDKIHSGCAVLNATNGDPVVITFGGTTTGTESWNPKTGTIQTLNENFPGPRPNSNFVSQVVTVDNGKALLYFMEKDDAPANVWKYVYATNTWTQVGSLTANKNFFLVLPAEGVQC